MGRSAEGKHIVRNIRCTRTRETYWQGNKLYCVGLGYRFLLLNFHIIFIWSTSPADISTHVPSSPELWYGRYKRLLNPCLSQDQLWARVYGAYSPVQALSPVEIRVETEGHKIRSYGWGFIFTGSYFIR